MAQLGLTGRLVRLAPPDRALHAENGYRWMNDPEVACTLERSLGITRKEQEAFFDGIEDRSNHQWVWAIHDPTDRHIGFIGMTVNLRNRSATGGIVLGERSAWGKGYATDAVRTRMRFGFEQMGLHRIDGHTINPPMRRVYEKTGYALEGIARQAHWSGGRWHDAFLYAILETEYFSAHPISPSPFSPSESRSQAEGVSL